MIVWLYLTGRRFLSMWIKKQNSMGCLHFMIRTSAIFILNELHNLTLAARKINLWPKTVNKVAVQRSKFDPKDKSRGCTIHTVWYILQNLLVPLPAKKSSASYLWGVAYGSRTLFMRLVTCYGVTRGGFTRQAVPSVFKADAKGLAHRWVECGMTCC